jgi:hypothetical protein
VGFFVFNHRRENRVSHRGHCNVFRYSSGSGIIFAAKPATLIAGLMSQSSPPDKPYKLTFEYRDKYLFAFVTGPKDSLEISIMFWKEVLEEAHAKNYKKLLVTEDFDEVISMPDMFFLVDGISKMGYHNIRIAFVDTKTDQFELNKFGETVATNRGIAGKVFSNIEEAERWLLQ